MESELVDLKATIGVLEHLITANSSLGNAVSDDVWRKVEADLEAHAGKIGALCDAALSHEREEEARHEREIEALKAEKGAPGSEEDLEEVDNLWKLLAGVAAVVAKRCAEHGYTAPPSLRLAEAPAAEPEPEPLSEPPLRW
jgi:hypothetical protein